MPSCLAWSTTAARVLAQVAPPLPPPPPPTPSATSTNYDQSAGNGALNLGVEFPGAARQPGIWRRQPGVPDQSRRRRRIGEHGRSALPHLVRGLRHLGPDRCARRLRRRQAEDGWRCRGLWRAARTGRQSRLLRRPEPHRHRRAAGASVRDARPDATRLQRLRRQGPLDLGLRGGARLRQGPFQPGYRPGPCDSGLSRRSRRRADRDQLLLDQGPDAHRAQGRTGICPRHQRRVPGGRRPRSTQCRLDGARLARAS